MCYKELISGTHLRAKRGQLDRSVPADTRILKTAGFRGSREAPFRGRPGPVLPRSGKGRPGAPVRPWEEALGGQSRPVLGRAPAPAGRACGTGGEPGR